MISMNIQPITRSTEKGCVMAAVIAKMATQPEIS